MTTTNQTIVNRNTIAQTFGTPSDITHRILMNCNFGFFQSHFENADQKWKEAHPFKYPAHDSIDFTSMDIQFVKKHITLFSTKQFWTSGGWGVNPKTNKTEWIYDSGYQTVEGIAGS